MSDKVGMQIFEADQKIKGRLRKKIAALEAERDALAAERDILRCELRYIAYGPRARLVAEVVEAAKKACGCENSSICLNDKRLCKALARLAAHDAGRGA